MMKSRIRRFYLLALWSPLIIPAMVAGGFSLQGGGSYTGTLAGIGMILLLSLWLAGLPYAIVAIWVSRWILMPEREERDVRRLMWRAPLVVAAFAMPVWIVMGTIEKDIINGMGESLIFLPYLLVIGYAYVGLTAVTYEVLRRTGYFHRADGVAAT